MMKMLVNPPPQEVFHGSTNKQRPPLRTHRAASRKKMRILTRCNMSTMMMALNAPALNGIAMASGQYRHAA
jgi:hypothetical protein